MKFKIGDEVEIKKELNTKEYDWYHDNPMIIIAIRHPNRYYTDYWHNGVIDFDNQFDSITRECLVHTKNFLRSCKLKRILYEKNIK